MAKSNPKSSKKSEHIYVIAGEDEVLVNAECEKLLNELLEPQQRAIALFNADPVSTPIAEILDELRTMPFAAEKRFVLIKKADGFLSKNRPLLEKYFDNPCPTGVLILTVNNWDSRTRLAKKLPDVGKLINVTALKSGELPGRLIKYAKEAHDKDLGRNAAEILIELTGGNAVQLYSEIDKLALFAQSEKNITAEHIEALVGHNRLFNAFAVIDAIVAGQPAKAVSRLRSMFAADRTTEFTVVGAFAFHFRKMFDAKVLLEKGLRYDDIVRQLRIFGDRNGFFSQLQKVTLKQIGENLRRLADIDYAIKTGRTKPQIAMEQLVLELAAK